nr:MAG TPA: hypothetical protein [Crassvirales sp.]
MIEIPIVVIMLLFIYGVICGAALCYIYIMRNL